MNIRKAVTDDIPRCLEMAAHFYEQTEYKTVIPFCPDSCAEWMQVAMDQNLFVVADTGDQLVGFILAISSPFIMNRNYTVGAELAWWMEPEHRKGTTGIKMLKTIEGLARDAGIRVWSMMSLEAVEPEKMDAIYCALAYRKTETTYMKVF